MKGHASPFAQRVWWAVRPLWYWRLLRLFLRSFWVSVAVGVGGWQLSQANGWPISLVVWGAVSYALFMVLFPSSLLWPIPIPLLARRLDVAFKLRDRLSTANEISERAPGNYLEQRLLTSANTLLRTVRGHLSRQNHMPWTDLALSVVALALLFGIYLNATTLDAPPPLTAAAAQPPNLPALTAEEPAPLPGLAPEDQPEPPPGSEDSQQNTAGKTPSADEAQAAMDALTEALGEQAITQSAAADLAQGNAEGAADRLRQLADQAGELDPEARQGLADSLQDAADQLADTAPDVSQALQDAAQGIAPSEGDPAESAAEAAAALEDLANLIEGLDQARTSGTSGTSEPAGSGGSAAGDAEGNSVDRESQSGGTTQRLQTDGQPVELPADQLTEDQTGVLQPPEHTGSATDTVNTPFTQTGASGTSSNQPADPLSFPWRLRRVIQRYFSPP